MQILVLALLAACGGGNGEPQPAPTTTEPRGASEAREATAAIEPVAVAMRDAQGNDVGTVTITPAGEGVSMALALRGLPPGTHAFHVHENPACDPPDFQSAGSHYNPEGRQHGLENPQGAHAGDMQNIEVAADGTVNVTVENPRVSLDPDAPNSLFAGGGTALVVHAQADDLQSDPAGNAGDRIACGVVRRNGDGNGTSP